MNDLAREFADVTLDPRYSDFVWNNSLLRTLLEESEEYIAEPVRSKFIQFMDENMASVDDIMLQGEAAAEHYNAVLGEMVGIDHAIALGFDKSQAAYEEYVAHFTELQRDLDEALIPLQRGGKELDAATSALARHIVNSFSLEETVEILEGLSKYFTTLRREPPVLIDSWGIGDPTYMMEDEEDEEYNDEDEVNDLDEDWEDKMHLDRQQLEQAEAAQHESVVEEVEELDPEPEQLTYQQVLDETPVGANASVNSYRFVQRLAADLAELLQENLA